MKKIILGLIIFVGFSSSVYAGEKMAETPKNEITSNVVNKSSVKEDHTKVKEYNCATKSNVAEGECWVMTATVEFCCDCPQVAASMGASLGAAKLLKDYMWVLQLLEVVAPC
jgi:hypothetical protein